VSQHLKPSVEMLVRLSAVIASRQIHKLSEHLDLVASQADAVRVEEVILQSYLFLGYPMALNVMALWRERVEPSPSVNLIEDRNCWVDRGEEICRSVYAGQYDELREHIRRLHPDLEQWMVEEGYGKVLGRSGLSLVERELCIVALLAVLDVPRQLYSHLRGALNVGAHVLEVTQALDIGLEYTEGAAAARGWETWEAVRSRDAGGR